MGIHARIGPPGPPHLVGGNPCIKDEITDPAERKGGHLAAERLAQSASVESARWVMREVERISLVVVRFAALVGRVSHDAIGGLAPPGVGRIDLVEQHQEGRGRGGQPRPAAAAADAGCR